jgi:hypothetical protein
VSKALLDFSTHGLAKIGFFGSEHAGERVAAAQADALADASKAENQHCPGSS